MKRLFKLPLTRDRVAGDIGDELDFHLQGRIDELVAAGMSREEADREARKRFGDRRRVETEVEGIDLTTLQRRNIRERLAALERDVRYAARGLTRKPLYACAAVLTLGLAIGANTTIFSVFDAVLLRPFPMPQLNRLVVVHDDFPGMNLRNAAISAQESLDLFARKYLFDVAAASMYDATTTDAGGTPMRMTGQATLGDFWALTGAKPLYGQLYRPEDSRLGAPSVVVLSYRTWQQISGDSTIIGRTIKFVDKPVEVIGVLRPEFTYPRNTAYWRPAVLDANTLDIRNRGTLTYRFIGRRSADLTAQQLDTELRTIADEWHKTYADHYTRGNHTLISQSFTEWSAGSLRPIVIALLGAVMFVLLIACANIASLQLVRTNSRSREFAVRAALGAGRFAIARQIVIESVILAVLGGAIGIAIGKGGLVLLAQANVGQFPALRGIGLNAYALAFTGGAIIVAAIAFGLAPALRASRTDVNDALRDGRGSGGGMRLRFLRASIIVQNALVLVLLIGAGLTIRSLDRLLTVDLGFKPDGVATFNVPFMGYAFSREWKLEFYRSLEERLKRTPGVQSVGFALGVPFTSQGGSTRYDLPTIPEQPGEPQRHANQAYVFGDYFKTMGMTFVRGRDFTPADQVTGGRTFVIDETLAKRSFGDADPIGVTINHGSAPGTIIGVVRPVKMFGLDENAHPLTYSDFGHVASFIPSLSVIVRSTLTPGELTKASRSIIRELDPRLAVDAARPIADRITDSVGAKRLARNVLAGFAALALVLALLGLYAVMSYVVTQRTREIGIRVALGAQRRQVAGMVMRDGAILAGLGLALGTAAFVALGGVARSLVYGIGVFDPVSIAIALALLVAITLVACWVPARRAIKVDPVVTLRTE